MIPISKDDIRNFHYKKTSLLKKNSDVIRIFIFRLISSLLLYLTIEKKVEIYITFSNYQWQIFRLYAKKILNLQYTIIFIIHWLS